MLKNLASTLLYSAAQALGWRVANSVPAPVMYACAIAAIVVVLYYGA